MIYPVAAFGVGGRGRWEGVSGYGGGGAESENPELCLLEASKTLENGFRPFSYWNTN